MVTEIKQYQNTIAKNLTRGKLITYKLITNNFISSIKIDDERVMHSNSKNTGIMISDEAYEVIKNLFDSLKNRYQNNFESMKGSELGSFIVS